MTEIVLTTLLWTVLITGALSLAFRDLFVSVILLSIFSFLSALLFYVSHAPDVAITEAAVGAGMTTLIFVWAVQSCAGPLPELEDRKYRHFKFEDLLDLLLVLLIGISLFLFLPPLTGGPVSLRDYLLLKGYQETGAVNLVSAVYLGYRAFDTFGETIVLLCGVTGSIYFLSRTY